MKYTLVLIGLLALWSCEEERTPRPSSSSSGATLQWAIPVRWIFDGGPGRDGIPAINDPQFVSVAEMGDRVRDFELAAAVKIGGTVKIYPYKIMDYHEIVNDRIDNEFYAFTYCPLTGTGINWSRVLDGGETEFGVSGLLFNNNLMPFDRGTNSTFSQMLNQGVSGRFIEDSVTILPSIEMSYGSLTRLYPNAQVLSLDTGFDRDYDVYPYGSYRTVEDLLFPQERIDQRLPAKERVLGVTIDGFTKVYRFSSFDGPVLYDTFRGRDLVIFRGGTQNFMKAYYRRFNGQLLDFTVVTDQEDAIYSDQNGTLWNAFGERVGQSGSNLAGPESYIGYWFAWAAFNENVSIR